MALNILFLCEAVRTLSDVIIHYYCMAKNRIIPQASSIGQRESARGKKQLGIIAYTERLIIHLHDAGKERLAEKYTAAIRSFQRYLSGKDVRLIEVSSLFMQGYESYLKDTGCCRNTISFYMRNLRAIYNHAVEEELITSNQPFKHVYTGVDKTVKRAVPLETIQQMKRLDLSLSSDLDFARDLFLLSFYLRGISFIDLVYLKKRDLRGGILCYYRKKTEQQLCVKWERPMQEIVDKYQRMHTPYLLPILSDADGDLYSQYKRAYKRMHRLLRELGERLHLSMPLTTYVARHTWASVAKSRHVPIGIISEALGHDSESTTKIYLSSLDTAEVDRVNSLIMDSL